MKTRQKRWGGFVIVRHSGPHGRERLARPASGVVYCGERLTLRQLLASIARNARNARLPW